MSLTFRPPPEVGLPVFPNILLYGPPKTGKTAGACSIPGQVTLLNADLPNATSYARNREGSRLMEVNFDGLNTLIDIANHVGQMKSVVVDPVGELHRRLMEEQSKRAIRPSINIYGDVSVHLERFCRFLCEAPITAVFVCHEYPVKDEATGQMERLPWTGTTNPSLGQKLMGMVDIVGYTGTVETEDEGTKYIAQLVNDKGRRGGDRFDVLGPWRELNVGEWIATITNTPPVNAGAKAQFMAEMDAIDADLKGTTNTPQEISA